MQPSMQLPANTATSPSFVALPARPGAVLGAPRALLRLEGATLLALAIAAFGHLGHGWGLFAAMFFAPDLAMLGYLAGARAGAAAYNATHTLLGPAALAALAHATHHSHLGALALIWAAHIGFDRLLGYGLKYESAFGHTHLR